MDRTFKSLIPDNPNIKINGFVKELIKTHQEFEEIKHPLVEKYGEEKAIDLIKNILDEASKIPHGDIHWVMKEIKKLY